MWHALERENNAVALGIRLLVDADFAVNHRHNAIAKFLVDKGFDGSAVDKDALKAQ